MSRSQAERELPPLAPDSRIGAVVSQYHAEISEAMLASARETLQGAGLAPDRLQVARVPGAFELPLAADMMARQPEIDAVLCFGLLLQGETIHDRVIATAVADGLVRSSVENEKPILFGLLTCASLGQAQRRARRRDDANGLDKGAEVARAAVEMLAALRQIEQP